MQEETAKIEMSVNGCITTLADMMNQLVCLRISAASVSKYFLLASRMVRTISVWPVEVEIVPTKNEDDALVQKPLIEREQSRRCLVKFCEGEFIQILASLDPADYEERATFDSCIADFRKLANNNMA